jgi:hypothetical protein
MKGPPDLGPRLVHLCLAPEGSVAAVDERRRTIPHAYDWHFAPFVPGPTIAVGWFSTFLPATEAGLRSLLEAPSLLESGSPKEPGRQTLELLRAVLAAWHGVAPKDEAVRSHLESFVWYAPVSGRTEAELPDEVKAQLALLDVRLAAAAK